MILRLFLFFISYIAMFGIPGYVVWRFALKPRWQTYQKKLEGRKHARELEAYKEMICFECFEECSEEDCYDSKLGWYHAKCYQTL